MASKSLIAALALSLGATALAAPTLLSAHDRNGRLGGMMGGMMMGDGPGAGFDFAAVDTDGDGKITEAELRAYHQARVSGVDTDGDNMISTEELTAKMIEGMQARAEAMAKARVEAQDANGDGKLSAEELLAPPMAGRLFLRMDADGDGAVSEDEIAEMHERLGQMHGGMWRDGGRNERMGEHGRWGGMMGHPMMDGYGHDDGWMGGGRGWGYWGDGSGQ